MFRPTEVSMSQCFGELQCMLYNLYQMVSIEFRMLYNLARRIVGGILPHSVAFPGCGMTKLAA